MHPRDPRFIAEQTRLLFRNALASITTTVLVASVTYGFLANASIPFAEIWLGGTLLVAAWRGHLAWRYHRSGGEVKDAARWLERFLLGAFAAGAAWGLLGAFFFAPAPTEIRIAIIMVLAGISAGAIGVFAVAMRVYAVFMLPMLVPLTFVLFMEGHRVFQLIAVMGVIFAVVSLLFARNTGRTLKEAILLKFAHEATLAELESEARMRDQMSAELIARDSQMRMLGENVPAIIAHYDDKEILRYCNQAYADMLDKAPDGILGRHASEILGAERTAWQEEFVKRALAGESQHYQSKHRKSDGSEISLDVRRTPFRSADGTIEGHFLFAIDTTERQRMEEALRLSEAKAKSFLQSLELSGEAIFSKALDGVVTSWNKGAERVYGYTAEEAIGRPMRDLHLKKLTDAEYLKVLQRIGSGKAATFEAQRQRKDESPIHVLCSTSPILDTDGTLIGETTVARDITEIRRAQLELAKTERELRLLIDNTPAMICYIDSQNRYRLVNKGYAELYGMSQAGFAGRDYRDLMNPALLPKIEHFFKQALTGQPIRYERAETTAAGVVRELVVQYVPNFGEGGVVIGVFSLLTDVTELKKIDRMKSEFVSTVSHELRTPLTSIRGSLGLLAGGVAGDIPGEARELVDIAQKNCERLINLINDILDIDKIESGKLDLEFVTADLMSLIDEAVAENTVYAGERQVSLCITGRINAAPVRVDPQRFAQIMANLLSNAAKYSPAQGRVEIAVQRHHDKFRVSVRDYGAGIGPEFKTRMFQRFSQSDSSDTRRVGGTGLGLAISKSIVEQFGGQIGFDSTLGEGSTFYFDLPTANSAGIAAPPIADPALSPAALPGRRVLICEDDTDVASIIASMLVEVGIECVVCGTAADAREQLGRGHFDAMTLDLRLPDLDGLSLLADLRQTAATRDLPVVVITADRSRQNGFACGALAIADWLAKPIDQNRLSAAIQALGRREANALILHVEDDPDILHVVQSIVAERAEVHQAPSLASARTALIEKHYDLVILDLALADGCGADLLPLIESLTPPPPVLLFSAHEPGTGISSRVAAALVKSQVDNVNLLAMIRRLVA